MLNRNYYNTLGVGINSSAEEIKQAYRNLAKKYHPDKNWGDANAEEHFKEIQEAHEILSDEEQRKNYDIKLKYGKHERKFTHQNQRNKHRRNNTASKSDRIIILTTVIVIASLIPIAYFFSGTADEDTDARMRQMVLRELQNMPQRNEDLSSPKKILNADSPYNEIFGDGTFSDDSRGYVMIKNSEQAEVVICLVENNPPFKTIRNEYLDKGVDYRFTAIPNGKYFLKVFFGSNWNPRKKLLDGKISGGFEKEIRLCKYNSPNDIFEVKQFQQGGNIVFTSYEKKISPENSEATHITPEEFFH